MRPTQPSPPKRLRAERCVHCGKIYTHAFGIKGVCLRDHEHELVWTDIREEEMAYEVLSYYESSSSKQKNRDLLDEQTRAYILAGMALREAK